MDYWNFNIPILIYMTMAVLGALYFAGILGKFLGFVTLPWNIILLWPWALAVTAYVILFIYFKISE